jgi:3-oxoacyl-[acyl-carrier protein] reductase
VGTLDGKVAIVTGANHGIGAATAARLAELGCDVAVTYLRLDEADGEGGRPPQYAQQRRSGAEAVLARIEAAGRRCLGVEADLRDPATPAAVFDQTERELGPVSILVHNASGWREDTFGAIEDGDNEPVTAATFDAQFLVDARAGALLIAELAERSRRRNDGWGRVVTLTSGGPNGFPGQVSYGAAKAALDNYTMAAASELADLGITANVVHPPVTDTGWVTDEFREFVASSPHLTHVAEPDDVAEVIAWLCTDAAGLVSGNVVRLR